MFAFNGVMIHLRYFQMVINYDIHSLFIDGISYDIFLLFYGDNSYDTPSHYLSLELIHILFLYYDIQVI